MAGLANVEVVRSVSLFGLSYVGVYFTDDVDIYFARRLVGEKLQEVKGAGVVGEQPVLRPGESYEYTSGVPLPTASGFMTGSYGMVTDAGEPFDVDIPAFSLDSSEGGRTIN